MGPLNEAPLVPVTEHLPFSLQRRKLKMTVRAQEAWHAAEAG